MSYQPALPPPQIQIRVAITNRGQPKKHLAGFGQDRRIVYHGWYNFLTDDAWFKFRLGDIYRYPTFGVGNFQELMQLPDPGITWVRKYYRRPGDTRGYEAHVAIPAVFDLEFSVLGG